MHGKRCEISPSMFVQINTANHWVFVWIFPWIRCVVPHQMKWGQGEMRPWSQLTSHNQGRSTSVACTSGTNIWTLSACPPWLETRDHCFPLAVIIIPVFSVGTFAWESGNGHCDVVWAFSWGYYWPCKWTGFTPSTRLVPPWIKRSFSPNEFHGSLSYFLDNSYFLTIRSISNIPVSQTGRTLVLPVSYSFSR